ncbi:DUF2218 domain-containing protein [Wenxinia marina]|uniref:2,4-dihydroxyhept-2-ene-1,7-dioic acid aldolase n=1 Tax=Wenxinia marina DSM 24838 TaxID=1123501 RepID=A0A0D0NM78_9RHOB|nr:DUF2218 domain-containing protein [Wenxinia marina]KIQ69405.1 hypothetical protein Wenmar_01767 [Wenxinia marina DSM 24838]GGL58078.1 hypothetical protein GCM10011392_10640 [Wenxinia marina]
MQEAISQEGRFRTGNGSRYLQQLCKHFAHKVDVAYDAHHGTVALPAGPARLEATEAELIVRVTADDADGLARARGVIDSHLERFAFREDFGGMEWE